MKTVTYECDRCKKVVAKGGVLWNVRIETECVVTGPGVYKAGPFTDACSDWCQSCMEVYGLLKPDRDSIVKPIDPPPTLEDLVKELVREIVREELPDGD